MRPPNVPVATPMIRMIGHDAPASREIDTPAAAATESAGALSAVSTGGTI
jgi:hypothetical protein